MTALPRIERGTFLVIRCDGSEEVIAEKPTPDRVRAAIGGVESVDYVTLTQTQGIGARPEIVMAVDGLGYEFETVDRATGKVVPYETVLNAAPDAVGHFELRATKARKPINPRATALYWSVCRPGTTHQIVGDVAVMHDRD